MEWSKRVMQGVTDLCTVECVIPVQAEADGEAAARGMRTTRSSVQYRHTVKFTALKDEYFDEELKKSRGGKAGAKKSDVAEVRAGEARPGPRRVMPLTEVRAAEARPGPRRVMPLR